MVSLFKLRGEALCSVLLELSHADSERLREWAVHLLAGVDDERATSRLDAVANDETQSKVVRSTAVRALDADPGSSGGSSAAAPKTTARTYPARARSTADRTCEPLGSGIGDDTDTDTNTMTDPTADISDDAVDADETDENGRTERSEIIRRCRRGGAPEGPGPGSRRERIRGRRRRGRDGRG